MELIEDFIVSSFNSFSKSVQMMPFSLSALSARSEHRKAHRRDAQREHQDHAYDDGEDLLAAVLARLGLRLALCALFGCFDARFTLRGSDFLLGLLLLLGHFDSSKLSAGTMRAANEHTSVNHTMRTFPKPEVHRVSSSQAAREVLINLLLPKGL